MKPELHLVFQSHRDREWFIELISKMNICDYRFVEGEE